MIERIERITPVQGANQVEQVQPVHRREAGGQFGTMLRRELESPAQATESFAVAFSKHAMARAEERGIEITPSLMDQIRGSMVRAQAKGATNILAFDATRAFIINVPHGRVITTMSQEEMEENIFTNIDGAVLLK